MINISLLEVPGGYTVYLAGKSYVGQRWCTVIALAGHMRSKGKVSAEAEKAVEEIRRLNLTTVGSFSDLPQAVQTWVKAEGEIRPVHGR
jgi:hypothetical protein